MSSAAKRLVLQASLARVITTIAAALKDLVLYKLLLRSSELSRQVNRVCAFSRVRKECTQ